MREQIVEPINQSINQKRHRSGLLSSTNQELTPSKSTPRTQPKLCPDKLEFVSWVGSYTTKSNSDVRLHTTLLPHAALYWSPSYIWDQSRSGVNLVPYTPHWIHTLHCMDPRRGISRFDHLQHYPWGICSSFTSIQVTMNIKYFYQWLAQSSTKIHHDLTETLLKIVAMVASKQFPSSPASRYREQYFLLELHRIT